MCYENIIDINIFLFTLHTLLYQTSEKKKKKAFSQPKKIRRRRRFCLILVFFLKKGLLALANRHFIITVSD